MKYSILFIALILVLPLFILGCDDNNNSINGTARTENDFCNDPDLMVNLEESVVVSFLENPMSEELDCDTGKLGIDHIPVTYTEKVEQTLCWEDDDPDAMHFMEFVDSEGNEILKVDVNGECVTEIIEAGDYVMTIHHDGRNFTTYPLFIRADPDPLFIPHYFSPVPDDIQEATKKLDGLINNLRIITTQITEALRNTLYIDARAQSCTRHQTVAGDVVLRLVPPFTPDPQPTSNSALDESADCVIPFRFIADTVSPMITDLRLNISIGLCTACDLKGADLSRSNLTGTDLSYANLTGADLNGTNLTGADLSFATWIDGVTICAINSVGCCRIIDGRCL